MAFTINRTDLVHIGSSTGHPVVDAASPLTRLNYFDGKFLRAPDMQSEQAALLTQVRLASQAGGGGIVHGFDCELAGGDVLRVSNGLGFDWLGRPLLMTQSIDIGVGDLIAASQSTATSLAQRSATGLRADFEDCPIRATPLGEDNVISGGAYYLIVLNHIEAFCGEEDVYGKLCSEACISDTARSHIIEGVEIRAVPVSLALKQSSHPFDNRHLRSRAASALFEKERLAIASLISGQGLFSNTWCLGAEPLTGQGIAIALLGRSATSTLFLDAWAARRERIDTPPLQYWAARMAMRSTRIYYAQIAQFQCQLSVCLTKASDSGQPPAPGDPCAEEKLLLKSTAADMDVLVRFYAKAAEQLPNLLDTFGGGASERLDIGRLERSVDALRRAGVAPLSDQILIDCGIVEMPSAGYLPVAPTSNLSVNRQVRQLLGDGVDLRFCVVRPDFVQHALEEAQHMERVCLVTGLDDPTQKQALDILVPDGRIEAVEQEIAGEGLRSQVSLSSMAFEIGWPQDAQFRPQSTLTTNLPRTEGTERATTVGLRLPASRGDLPVAGGAARSDDSQGGPVFYLAAESAQVGLSDAASDNLAGRAPQEVLSLLGANVTTVTGTDSGRATSGLRINRAVAPLGMNLSLWVELQASSDPFSARAGQRVEVHAKVIVAGRIARDETLVVEQRTVNGHLAIENNVAIAGGAEVTGRLVAEGLWQEERTAGGQSSKRIDAIAIKDGVVLRRGQVAGLPPSVNITLLNPSFFGGLDNIHLVFEQTWVSPTERNFRSFIRLQSAKTLGLETAFLRAERAREDIELVNGTLVADADALTSGSEPHSASLRAIRDIAGALDSHSFAETAAVALFPAPVPVPDELEIIARHPWVLFHRRRDKVCEHERAAEVVQPARVYRVFHVHIAEQTTTDELIAAIEADFAAAIEGLGVKPAGTVEFAPGLQSVATPHTDVRANWQAAVQVDADLHVGVIATQGDALNDGVPLASARLQSLTDVLAPVSQGAPDLQLLTTANIPPGLSTGELDGIVVYFAKAVGTVCHTVFRLSGNNPDTIVEKLEAYFANPGNETLTNFVQQIGGKVLSASPRFIDGTDDYFTPSEPRQVAANWDLLGGGSVTNALAVSPETDAASQAVAVSQSGKLVGTVGGDLAAADILHRTLQPGLLKPCPRATILLAGTQCNEVILYTPFRVDDLAELSKDLVASIEQEGLTRELFEPVTGATTSLFARLGTVDFFAGTDNFEPDSRDAFRVVWQQRLGGTSPAAVDAAFIGVGRAGSNGEETAANKSLALKQGESLRALMGLSAPQTVPTINQPQAAFPVECAGLTLVVVPTGRLGLTTIAVSRRGDADGASDDADRPSLAADTADSFSFDAHGGLVRDAQFTAAIDALKAANQSVSRVEIVALGGHSDPKARARAEAVLAALKEAGAARRNAKVVERAPDARERAEIIKSGFVLNNGLVLG